MHSNECLRAITANFRDLEALYLGCCIDLTDESLRTIADLPNLKRLRIGGNNNLSDSTIEAIVSRGKIEVLFFNFTFKMFQKIHLAFGSKVSDSALKSLAEHCKVGGK